MKIGWRHNNHLLLVFVLWHVASASARRRVIRGSKLFGKKIRGYQSKGSNQKVSSVLAPLEYLAYMKLTLRSRVEVDAEASPKTHGSKIGIRDVSFRTQGLEISPQHPD